MGYERQPLEEYIKQKEEQRFASQITPKDCNIELEEDIFFIIHGQKLCLDLDMADFKGHDVREVEYGVFSQQGEHQHFDGIYKYRFCHTCFKITFPFCKTTIGKSNYPISGCDTYLFLFQDMTKEKV